MTALSRHGTALHRRSSEKPVPSIDWFSFVNKVAERLWKRLKMSITSPGYKHSDQDYWRVLVWRQMNNVSIAEAADELNETLIDIARDGRGRKPREPKLLGGKWPRHERMAPNASQVNAFLRRMPPALKSRLVDTIFKAQIDLCLEMGFITKKITVYFDFTKDDYYGKDVFPANTCITNVHDGRGTNKARKHAAMMLSSGSTWLFAGVVLVKRGLAKELYVGTMVQRLVNWGFSIKNVHGDREISTFDVIATLVNKQLPYTGTMKKTIPVKRIVDEFLKGKVHVVVPHALTPHQGSRAASGPVPVHIIMKVDPGKHAKDLRRQLRLGKVTFADARKHVHVFITTSTPPRQKEKLTRWGMRLVQEFKKRWRIETGFRDCESFAPASHARDNNTKTFHVALGMISFNAWMIQRVMCKRLRDVPGTTKRGPTLRRFCRTASKAHVHGKNSTDSSIIGAISSVLATI